MGDSRKYSNWSWFQTERLGDEPIYCEASQGPDDVIYSGSEDEYYESATTRRLRYEAQALRYLAGNQPMLISASLKGPFTEECGWTNPWQSKRAKVRKATATPPKLAKYDEVVIPGTKSQILEVDDADTEEEADQLSGLEQLRTGSRLPNHERPSTQATSLYPLPSPGSTHAPSVVSNPYMDSSAFSRVQKWRDDVKTTVASKEQFWAPDAAKHERMGSKKRPSDSEWLKKKASKRAKLDTADSSMIDSPIDAVIEKRSFRPSTSARTTAGSSTSGLSKETRGVKSRRRHEQGRTGTEETPKSSTGPHGERLVSQTTSSSAFPAGDASTRAVRSSLPSRSRGKQSQSLVPSIPPLDELSSNASQSQSPPARDSHSPASVTRDVPSNLTQRGPSGSHTFQSSQPTGGGKCTAIKNEAHSSSPHGEEEAVIALETQHDRSFQFRARAKKEPTVSPRASHRPRSTRTASTSSLSSCPSDRISNLDEFERPVPLSPSDSQHGGDHVRRPPEDDAEQHQNLFHNEIGSDKSSDKEKELAEDVTQTADPDIELEDIKASQASHHSLIHQPAPSATSDSSLTSIESSSDFEQLTGAHDTRTPEIKNIQREEHPVEDQTETIVVSMSQEEGLVSVESDDMTKVNLSRPCKGGRNITEQNEVRLTEDSQCQAEAQSPWMKPVQEVLCYPQDVDAMHQNTPNELDQTQDGQHLRYNEAPENTIASMHPAVATGASPHDRGISSSEAFALPELRHVERALLGHPSSFPGLDIIASQALSAMFPSSSQNLVPNSSPDRQLLLESFDRFWDGNEASNTGRPSTPNHGGSMVPDTESAIKPFSNFLTLSPEKQWKPQRASLASAGRLPSTQILVDATTSNPWSNFSEKSNRRVSFARLPSEHNESDQDANKENEDAAGELPTQLSTPSLRKDDTRKRAASPPLPSHSDDLQDHDHRFAAHFQAMIKQGRGPRLAHRLLPSSSQQLQGSPKVEAMAEAFIEAEREEADVVANKPPSPAPRSSWLDVVVSQHNDESTDDVSAVIDNLGDFLNAFDVDAELAEARPMSRPAAGASQLTGMEVNAWSS